MSTKLVFRVSNSLDVGYGAHRQLSITVNTAERCDAMDDIKNSLGRSAETLAHLTERASTIRRLTGSTIYYLCSDAVEITWQSNADSPDRWYGAHVKASLTDDAAKIIVRLAKLLIADKSPSGLIATLTAAGAFAVKYPRELYLFVRDDDFSVSSLAPQELAVA